MKRLLVLILLASVPTCVLAQNGGPRIDSGNLIVDKWVPRSPEDTDAEAYVKAVLHGRVLGYRQVLQDVGGVAIMGRGTATVKRLKDFVTFEVGEAILNTGIVLTKIEQERMKDGSRGYRLEYHVPMTGDGSVLNAVWDGVRQEAQRNPRSPVEAEQPEDKIYTGLVVDLRGYNVAQDPVVAVLTADGREAYGAVKPGNDYVRRYGMVGYGRTLDTPRSIRERVGDNPLVIKATGQAGSDAIVSDEDAQSIAAADATAGFLAEARVAFLIGPK